MTRSRAKPNEQQKAERLQIEAERTQSILADYADMNADLDVGIIGIRVRTAVDDFVCEFCQSMHHAVISLDEARSFAPPFSQCSSDIGCRCYFSPVLEEPR